MNKTVNINLGGFFFHIDEDAYQKLNRYFDAIKRSLSPDGKEEIMNDIESRIAELLSEKMKNEKQVVGAREVEEVIAVMGQPEDYRIDEDTAQKQTYTSNYPPGYNPVSTRKFYRDGDNAIVSGVCAGIGHYFRIDPLWIRIVFVISLFLSFGTSVFVYILLWVLIPKAITTTEKLEMTGEEINISNIEKKVREEIGNISERLQNVDYDKLGAQAKTGAEKVGSGISYVMIGFFKIIAKIIGAVLTIFSALTLGALIITFFAMLFSTAIIDTRFHHFANIVNYTDAPLWIIGLLGLFAIGIPFFFLFLLGLKILVDNLKPVGNITKYTLLALWIVSVAVCSYLGIRQGVEVSYDGKTVVKKHLNITVNDTLLIKFKHNDYYTKTIDYNNEDFTFKQDSAGNDIIYSNNVSIYFFKTDDAPYVQVEKIARGKSSSDARSTAEKIKYNFTIEGNTLILDNYFTLDIQNKYRQQEIEIFVYLPEGIQFKPDASVQIYDETDNNFFDLWFDSDTYIYRMEKNNVKCLNCPPKEGEEENNEREYLPGEESRGNVKGNIARGRDSISFSINKV